MQVKLGWNTADLLTGAVNDLLAKYPDNKPLKALHEQLASGSDEPLTITFDDDNED